VSLLGFGRGAPHVARIDHEEEEQDKPDHPYDQTGDDERQRPVGLDVLRCDQRPWRTKIKLKLTDRAALPKMLPMLV
jgi:hypothetical protein